MYTQFFNLRETPFSITPDPAYLYMSPRHQEALGHLLYGTGQYGGFVQLTGEVGTGKTTIVRSLLEQKLPEVDVAIIHNPRLSEQEFVQTICDELGVAYPREQLSLKTLIDALNEHLLRAHAAGRRTVLIIDEAQNLQPSVLEQVRLLTNLETAKEKLLRIMLIGQPELSELLARPDLRQLASRITARYHLTPLGLRETVEYIQHRLRVAGGVGEIFTPAATDEIHRFTKGVPRLINIVCDRALLGAYAQNARRVTPEIVRKAAREAIGQMPDVFDPRAPHRWRWIEIGWAIALVLSVGLLGWSLSRDRQIAQQESLPANTPAPSLATAPVVVADPRADLATMERTIEPLGELMERLIRRWDRELVVPAGQNVCKALKKSGLDCYRDRGGWADLGQINRPAILTLDLPGAGRQYVLLTALDTKRAHFNSARGPVSVDLETVESVWSGEFLVLWRREIGETRIGPQTRGAPITWIWLRLAALEKLQAPTPLPNRYDDALATAIKQFQRNHGMKPDGIAGTRTMLALGDGQPNTPTLAVSELAAEATP